MAQQAEDGSAFRRLIAAVWEAWETSGSMAMSTRMLAQAAQLPVSSIYYHFGDLEHLYEAAGNEALNAAGRWCAKQLDDMRGVGSLSPEAFPGLVAGLIDEWSHGNPKLAFAWRECQLRAGRDGAAHPLALAWYTMWRDFWRQVCAACQVEDASDATAMFFDGESFLHLLRWRRVADRACLDESCRGWATWLTGGLAAEGPWRRAARGEAMRTTPAVRPLQGVAEQIAGAAAEIVAERGAAGLTHRAVAAHAGLTLGVVSYNFRTSADLLGAAFEAIYRRLVPVEAEERLIRGEDDPASAYAMLTGREGRERGWLLAMEEFMLAVARDPARHDFAAQLRYLRGRTAGRLLSSLLGRGDISPLDAALFSSFSGGRERLLNVAGPETRSAADATLNALLARLR